MQYWLKYLLKSKETRINKLLGLLLNYFWRYCQKFISVYKVLRYVFTQFWDVPDIYEKKFHVLSYSVNCEATQIESFLLFMLLPFCLHWTIPIVYLIIWPHLQIKLNIETLLNKISQNLVSRRKMYFQRS